MSPPPANAESLPPAWYARPAVVLSLLGILVLLTALLVKAPVSGRSGDGRLLTTSTSPLGAKLLYELAGKLGYSVRRERVNAVPTDTQTIFAVLDPVVELDGATVHRQLEFVRKGGALLVALGNGTEILSDSLGISVREIGGSVSPAFEKCMAEPMLNRNGLWLGTASLYGLNIADSLLPRMVPFIRTGVRFEKPDPHSWALVGFSFGEGRIVVASDPDVFRNDALRYCWYALDVPTVASLEYLRGGAGGQRKNLVFDEYHLDLQQRPSSNALVREYLTGTPSGRMLLQICVAGLVLLLAAAPRVLRPREDRRLERRSPLEHVDALSRAYAQVGATRTGTLRLVRGLQRRVGVASRWDTNRRSSAQQQDEEFLLRVAESRPALAGDVATVARALGNSIDAKSFQEVGSAIQRIEAALTKT